MMMSFAFQNTRRGGLVPAALAVAFLGFSGCTSGSDTASTLAGGDFIVLRTEPAPNGRLFLNDPIAIDFTNRVDISTANLNTVAFEVFDAAGTALAEQPVGSFRLATSPGDTEPGRRLEFVPQFPSNNSYTNGGFRPGRTYLVNLVGGNARNNNVLKDISGKSLAIPQSFQFSTANGTTPAELFRDRLAGGPRRVGFSVTPTTSGGSNPGTALNKSGQALVQIVLQFNQPLNPATSNVPVDFDPDPLARVEGQRGRIFLEYDDPDPLVGSSVWIPAVVRLTENTLSSSEVRLFPVGVLPNNAEIRVIVENTLEDMSGESNVGDASYSRQFAKIFTRESYEPQFDAIVAQFDQNSEQIDFEAPFLEPFAEVGNGFVKAAFEFDGSSTILDYEPAASQVFLNTDFTQITPKGAPPFNVAGGVFRFRNVRIPEGVSVIGRGTKPMIWQVTNDFEVDGILQVNGGAGDRVNTLRSANFVTGGGVGSCGGGNGGVGSPNTSGQSPTGEAGFGPGQVPEGGGGGGLLGAGSCSRGSGGGGGSMSTQGDPNFPAKAQGTSFVQQIGQGGYGCSGSSGAASRTLPGGLPGPEVFRDSRKDNNFWGSGVDLARLIRINGELAAPIGGSGGGGGGDKAPSVGNNNWISNNKGGGGGAGGGVLVIQALGKIRIGAQGVVSADGGTGGGGEQAGGNNQGGGGGGGSGGMVVLMAGDRIELTMHGETYANGDYSYAISADGSTGTQGQFGGAEWFGKYPPPSPRTQWDSNPSGALGGMGLVQLMAPAGVDNADGTNTVLDDNILLYEANGNLVTDPADKIRYLAWRGFLNGAGEWVDDEGNLTYSNGATIDDEGDIRPAPVLLPSPISHKSRVRSKWIDTGRSVRLPFATNGPGARTIQESQNFLAGPTYTFTGTNADTSSNWTGYLDYDQTVTGIALKGPTVVAPTSIASADRNSTFEGELAYRVTLTDAVMGSIADRYSQYQARITDSGGTVLGEFRIVGHDQRVVYLSPDQGSLPSQNDMRLAVIERFVQVFTNGSRGLGPTYQVPTGATTSKNLPVANIQIGFAFHRDPTPKLGQPPITKGDDPDRLPTTVGTFLYDLGDPARQEEVRQFMGGAAFVQWDVVFNTRYSEDAPNNTAPNIPLTPSSPLPELRSLVIPYRF